MPNDIISISSFLQGQVPPIPSCLLLKDRLYAQVSTVQKLSVPDPVLGNSTTATLRAWIGALAPFLEVILPFILCFANRGASFEL